MIHNRPCACKQQYTAIQQPTATPRMQVLQDKGLDVQQLCTMSAWALMESGIVVLPQLTKLMDGLAALK